MPTANCPCITDQTPGTNWYSNIGDKVAAVALPEDGWASMDIDGYGHIQRFAIDTSGVPAGATINSVSLYHVSYGAGSDYRRGRIYLNGSYSDTEYFVDNAVVTRLDELSRPGGGTWDYDDLASLEACYQDQPGIPNSIYLFTLYIVIDYTESEPEPPAPPTDNGNIVPFLNCLAT